MFVGYNFRLVSFIALFVFFFSPITIGQITHFNLNWLKPTVVQLNTEKLKLPTLEDGSLKEGLPYFSKINEIKDATYDFKVGNIQYSEATSDDKYFFERMNKIIPSEIEINVFARKSRNKQYMIVDAFPFVLKEGQLKRILSFDVSSTIVSLNKKTKNKDYTANSVLRNGDWYAIKVEKDGVHKIDFNFLKNCGIDIKNVPPTSIHVFGNSSGVLSEQNNGRFQDDLKQNSIYFSGTSDGKFDETDYILFYGTSPHKWEYFGNEFSRKIHPYSDFSVYYIYIGADFTSKLVALESGTTNATTDQINDYDYVSIHEIESTNLLKGGQRWYGELFDSELTQNISFNIPNRLTDSSIKIDYAFAALTKTDGNSLIFKHNGTQLNNIDISTTGSDYGRSTSSFTFKSTSAELLFQLTFNRSNPGSKCYLDYLELQTRSKLKFTGTQFVFRDKAHIGLNRVGNFEIEGASTNQLVWDVTNPVAAFQMNTTTSTNSLSFKARMDSLRTFVIFDLATDLKPLFIKKIPNQNLHALEVADLTIVTTEEFIPEATRLANLHINDGISVHVVTCQSIYNEFSSGMQDPTAIRRFMKMFYDRAGGNQQLMPKHLLLFGDATYDPKNRVSNNNYVVPTYETVNSESYLGSMVSDDYFGLLDDNESFNGPDLMDISVGRLLITTQEHAVNQVNKIEHYMKNGSDLYAGSSNDCCLGDDNSTFGDWRTHYSLITDDEEDGYFISTDAEPVTNVVNNLYHEMNVQKLYMDAFVQTSTAGGQRYPDIFEAITEKIERGTLVMNYIGHGGEAGAAEERVITIPQINEWNNIDRLPLFVTATCEFTRFDDPSRESAGELVSINPNGGSIALMTTTRAVFFGVNSNTIKKFYENVFDRDSLFNPLTFGEIMRLTKNESGTSDNRRSFTLIGDPALRISLPKWRIVTDSINHRDPKLYADTLRALSFVEIKGHVEDDKGNILTNFDGTLSPTIYDKVKLTKTLGNDPDSPIIPFSVQNNALYKGKATVKSGRFTFKYIVPKDINYAFGKGKISYYGDAKGLSTDADGFDTNFVVGGINSNAPTDVTGPEISLYMNDKRFVDGSITSNEPVLLIECADEYGINTVGNGVGHDLVAILDGNTAEPIILNDYYVGKLDSYQAGEVRYVLKDLSTGEHTLDVKVWDVNNNSSVSRINFRVVDNEQMAIDRVYNYPNPFTTKTSFFYEHNQSCSFLDTQIQIYTVSGRLVRTINQQVATAGFRTEGITWDGLDDFGDQLAKGVYIYRISVELPNTGKAQKVEKLVLLK